jgi:thioesterase domain-containing protein
MDVLQVPRVGRHDDFFELGGHSLLTVALLAQIEEAFSQDIAHSALFGSATIASQAEILRQNVVLDATPSWPSIVTLQPGGTCPPLFFVHDIGESLLCYRELVRSLGKDQPVYGLRPVEQDDKSSTRSLAHARSIEEMAAGYVRDLCTFQPHGAFYLCGHSFAGTLAFEIARQLEMQGRRVALLALLDTSCRADPTHREQSKTYLTRRQRQRNHRYIWRHLRARDRVIYFSYYAHERVNSMQKRFGRWTKADERNGAQQEVRRLYAKNQQRNKAASACYCVQNYGGRITLFRAMLDYCEARSLDLGWQPFAAGGVEVVKISGNHDEMLKSPHVRMLARRFRQCLSEARQNDSLHIGDLHQDRPASNVNRCARNVVTSDASRWQF